jgi:hypothetical protein
MQNISGFGTKVTIVATQSFPVGFTVSKFADDKDPIKIEEIEPTGYEVIIDGSLFTFDKGAPVKVQISVIPGSDDDINLKILLQARKSSPSIIPLKDITAIVISYGNGGTTAFSGGSIISGPLSDSINQGGRMVGNTYTFIFSDFSGAQSALELGTDIARSLIGAH